MIMPSATANLWRTRVNVAIGGLQWERWERAALAVRVVLGGPTRERMKL
jgi:hypothetical protein